MQPLHTWQASRTSLAEQRAGRVQAQITFETPGAPASGQGLDYEVALLPIFGDPDLRILRTAQGGGAIPTEFLNPTGTDRARFYSEDLVTPTSFQVYINSATLSTQYQLTIEAFFGNSTLAAEDLAVRSATAARAPFRLGLSPL